MQGRIQEGERTLKLEKNMIFLPKIVIFHTKYPKQIWSVASHGIKLDQ